MTPKFRPGRVVVLNRGVPKRPGGKGKAVYLEVGRQFVVEKLVSAGGTYWDYDLRDADGAVWRGVPEIALDPAEGGPAGDGPPAPAPPPGTLFG